MVNTLVTATEFLAMLRNKGITLSDFMELQGAFDLIDTKLPLE